MKRQPRPVCSRCGRPLPKEKPAPAAPTGPSDADQVRRIRERTERSNAAGRTASMDLGISETKAAPLPELPREPEQDALWPGVERKE